MTFPETDGAEILVELRDEHATRDLGAALASAITPGTVVLLDGPLGAGKTTLVQGFAAAMGSRHAASPSFVLAHHYANARMPVWHLDLYRIDRASEIAALDFDQYLPADGVALVEWASRAPDDWPSDRIDVALSIEGGGRRARLRGCGAGAAALQGLDAKMLRLAQSRSRV